MPVARLAQAVQQAVFANARLAPAVLSCSTGQHMFSRFFASGYLDRNDVTERILNSMKSFEKIDSSKVSFWPQSTCCCSPAHLITLLCAAVHCI